MPRGTVVSGSNGGVKYSIEWDISEISGNLDALPAFIDRAVAAVMKRNEGPAEAFARSNAPWNDQTGNARSGLKAISGGAGGVRYLDIQHSVDYGIWLETRWGGKYAILEKTLDYIGPKVMREFDGLLDRYPRGA